MQPRLQVMALTVEARLPDDWPTCAAAESAKWRDFVRARGSRIQ